VSTVAGAARLASSARTAAAYALPSSSARARRLASSWATLSHCGGERVSARLTCGTREAQVSMDAERRARTHLSRVRVRSKIPPEKQNVRLRAVDGVVLPSAALLHPETTPLVLAQQLALKVADELLWQNYVTAQGTSTVSEARARGGAKALNCPGFALPGHRPLG